MAKRRRTLHPTAQILFDMLNAGQFTRTDVMKTLGLRSTQVVTNWLANGIPSGQMPGVAAMCGLNTDEYRSRVGLSSFERRHTIQPRTPDSERLVANFETLPAGFQQYLLRKTQEIRKYASNLSAFAQFTARPPVGTVAFYEWESQLFSEMAKLALAGKLSPTEEEIGEPGRLTP